MNTITTGDCIEQLAAIPAGSVNLIVADPPCNIGIDYGAGPEADDLARDAVADAAVAAGIIASSNGSAKEAPIPRKNVRRGRAFFVMIMGSSSSETGCWSRYRELKRRNENPPRWPDGLFAE